VLATGSDLSDEVFVALFGHGRVDALLLLGRERRAVLNLQEFR
jgi:hypothetical protein